MRHTAILRSLAAALLLAGWGPNSGSSGEALLKLADVFELEYASDPQIAPDGRKIAYVRNRMDIMTDRRRSSLWLIDAKTAEHRPITSGGQNDSSPRWSPDGTRLAYVRAAEGDSEIHCRWMDSGQTACLARLADSPDHLAWSPEGTRLAFTMHVPERPEPFVELPAKPEGAQWAEPAKLIRKVLYRFDGKGYLKEGFQHVFVLPAEGGTPRQLTDGPFDHLGPLSWTPDGRAILFSANRNPDWEYQPKNTEIHSVSVADGKIRTLTDRDGPDQHPAVSPDGHRIAYVGYDDRRQGYQVTRLYVMNQDGSEKRVVTGQFDREVRSPVWDSQGDGLFFLFDDQGITKIGRTTLEGRVETLARDVGGVTIGRPYASGSFSVSSRSSVAFTLTRPDHPADVAVASPAGSSSVRRLTALNADLLDTKSLPQIEEIRFPSSADGREIQAWLLKPPGFESKKKYPLILEIHGGPFANYGERFSIEMQLYAAAGYGLLFVNPRGSTGYGEEFGNLIHHAYPGDDYHDLMSGVDAALAKGWIDEKNQFVTGGSGGGVLTAWIVGKTGRFRAAVSAKPVINWYSFALTADMYPFFTQYWFPGPPWEHAEHYLRRSPLSLVGNVTTPTMLLTGEADHRTPISESEQFYQALKLRKIDAALVRVPGASHDISARPSQLITSVAHVLAWFEKHRAQP